MLKRKQISEEAGSFDDIDSSQQAVIVPLGAGQEVGRSCILFKYQNRTVMFDFGIHPGFRSRQSLPMIESVDPTKIDVALITHFHMDHCAALPYLLRKTTFKGRVFMTHPTKAIYYSLLKDFVKGNRGTADEGLYSREDLDASMDMIEVIDFYQTVEVNGIKITPYRAGHVLGAAMFRVEIEGLSCLYTGDYSCIPDRHLPAADIPAEKVDIVVVESTYGVSRHLPVHAREQQLLNKIHEAVLQGGRVLLPVVAMGRAQEVLLLLDEHWSRHPELAHVPIFQANAVMHKALGAYQTYVAALNEDVRRLFRERNPFQFRHVQTLSSPAQLLQDYSGPCVAMATPSGLQSGVSRDCFDAWCEDARNACVVCDFAVQGTLARQVLGRPATVTTREGRNVPLRMAVHNISFSAHADFDQTSSFLTAVQPRHVVLVHGEKEGMRRLAEALRKAAGQGAGKWDVHTPALVSPITIPHMPNMTVRVAGQLASQPPKVGAELHGILVQDALSASGSGSGSTSAQAAEAAARGVDTMQLMSPEDLSEFTKLLKGRVTQKQTLSFRGVPFSAIRLALEVMFDGVQEFGHLPVLAVHPRAEPEAEAVPASKKSRILREARTLIIGGKVAVTCLFSCDACVGATAHDDMGTTSQTALAASVGPSSSSALAAAALSPESAAGRLLRDPVEDLRGALTAGPTVLGSGPGSGEAITSVLLEWEGGRPSDLVADAVVAVILQAIGEPAEVSIAESARARALTSGDQAAEAAAELETLAALLGTQFGRAEVDASSDCVVVEVDEGITIIVDRMSGAVQCKDPLLAGRVEKAVGRLLMAMRPIPSRAAGADSSEEEGSSGSEAAAYSDDDEGAMASLAGTELSSSAGGDSDAEADVEVTTGDATGGAPYLFCGDDVYEGVSRLLAPVP